VVVVAAVVLIGLAVIGSSTSGGAGLYDYSLAQLAAAGASVEGRDIKVSGNVAHGSVRGEPGGSDFRFDLDDGQGHRLTVAYPRLLPDPFEEGRTAIVQGRLQQGVLQASNLTVKCPSRYADGAANLSEAEQQRYYQGAYRQHQAAQAGKAAAPAAPAAAAASPTAR
jgi:cytochrome c-type biogenesis protein CcmE